MFPLPLTPFERYYWHDDRPGYPPAYAFELSFRGSLARLPLERALAAVVDRHPLFSAQIAPGPHGPQWIRGDDRSPPIDWTDNGVPLYSVTTHSSCSLSQITASRTAAASAWNCS